MSTTTKVVWLVVFALCVRVEAQTGRPRPMRNDVPKAGREILVLRNHELKPGGHEPFYQFSRDAYWPFFERLGARPIGQWKVVHPPAPSRTAESADFDEVITMTRYASAGQRQAMSADEAVYMGGNGPDWQAWRAALEAQRAATLDTRSELMEGHMFQSPPVYLPGLPERYRPAK